MFKRIVCAVRGHRLELATFDRPVKLSSGGVMHMGLVAKCVRCGKEVDAETSPGLPTLMPFRATPDRPPGE